MITRKILLALLLIGVAGVCGAAVQSVGEVSLVIGEAQLARSGGEVLAVARNMPVHPGDRIETSVGGHVHVRFVDGGMVSVRPESRLMIESYQREGAGNGGAIKFRLERGAVRSVTGEWGEENRERFRLNTPIAAIGVRGTDFVVQADKDQLRAAVVSGAIVVAPFGEGCRVEMLGPCATRQAATLAADMGNVMVELRRQEAAPRIVPLNDLQISPASVMRSEEVARRPSPPGGQDSVNESKAGRMLVEQAGLQVQEQGPAPASDLLVWGRWAALRPGDSMTVSQAEARDGGKRQIAIGSLDSYYLLYRSDGYSANFPASLGQVEFVFASGQAALLSGGDYLPVAVRGGTLGVNFATGQFSTVLGMSQSQLGDFRMSANGSVSSRGVLLYRASDGGYVTGALSTDGSRAAYAFGQMTGLGLVSGIANWGRR